MYAYETYRQLFFIKMDLDLLIKPITTTGTEKKHVNLCSNADL